MRRNLDNKNSVHFEKWIEQNLDSVIKTDPANPGWKQIELFACISAKKKLIALCEQNGFDAFKHGKIEPARVGAFVETITLDDFEGIDESGNVRGMFD